MDAQNKEKHSAGTFEGQFEMKLDYINPYKNGLLSIDGFST